jgi:hypothetical protein
MRGRATIAILTGGVAAFALLASTGAGAAVGGGAKGGPVVRDGAAEVLAKLGKRPASRQAVVRYLRSLGLRQRGLVVQRGLRNYAGPKCPGKRWNCTTARRVVQLGWSTHGGPVNKAECFAASCEIIQVAPNADNDAKCQQETSPNQFCRIMQSGHTNLATVVQKLLQKNVPIRAGQQKAFVEQAASGSGNTARVTQDVVQHTNLRSAGAIAQRLQADQFVDVNQSGSSGAANTADTFQHLKQDAVARATGQMSPIDQRINDQDLDTSTPRNTSAVIDQDSDTGANTATRRQAHEINATALAVRGDITQVQGSADGGLAGLSDDDVHQSSTGTASSTNQQTKQLSLSATTSPPGQVSQAQNDPAECCSQQIGAANSVFTLGQSSTVLASDAGADQTVRLIADLQTTGTATVQQTTNVDGEVRTDTCTGTTCQQEIETGSDTPPQTIVRNTDVASFGFGGMRGNGTGSITVEGVSGQVRRALLYWNGPTNSSSPTANAAVTFAGVPITGTNIGFAHDNCWGFANSQSYRADVTSLVPGDGVYSLANFVKAPDVEVNGAALVVFFDDGNTANNRSVTFFDGNDSNLASQFDPEGWEVTLTGVDYPGGSANLDFVVSDGQAFPDGALVLNGQTVVPQGAIFEGDSTPSGPGNFDGSLWDVESFDVTGFLTPGPDQTLTLTSGLVSDCLSAVYVAANVPAAAPPIE